MSEFKPTEDRIQELESPFARSASQQRKRGRSTCRSN